MLPTLIHPSPVLSLFPGAGLLDRAFEESGFSVVRGPDVIHGGDIRRFVPTSGGYWGVIGGPPCQEFSSLRRKPATGYGLAMLEEFVRCVVTAEPEWFLMENVSRVPDVTVPGYVVQRFDIDLKWYADATRLRHIQFGSRSGRFLHIERGRRSAGAECDASMGHAAGQPGESHPAPIAESRPDTAARPLPPAAARRKLPGAALASDKRSFRDLCRLQGLPADFALPGLTSAAAKRAVGNGVPLPMGRELARAVTAAYARPAPVLQRLLDGSVVPAWVCGCGCGRRVTGEETYYDASCRKRAQRRRERAAAGSREEAVA